MITSVSLLLLFFSLFVFYPYPTLTLSTEMFKLSRGCLLHAGVYLPKSRIVGVCCVSQSVPVVVYVRASCADTSVHEMRGQYVS